MWHSTFIKDYVTLWCLLRVTMNYVVHQGLCLIDTFVKGYVSLWHSSSNMGHWSRIICICLHNPRCDTLIMWNSTFIKDYVALWCLSRVTLNCDFHHEKYHIVTFVKGDVTLRHPLRVMSKCEIRQRLWGIVIMCNMWHSTFIKDLLHYDVY